MEIVIIPIIHWEKKSSLKRVLKVHHQWIYKKTWHWVCKIESVLQTGGSWHNRIFETFFIFISFLHTINFFLFFLQVSNPRTDNIRRTI